MDIHFKKELIAEIRNLDTDETEKVLCQRHVLKPRQVALARRQSDDSVRREVTFTAEEEAKFSRVRELISHTHPDLNFAELMIKLAEDFLEANDPERWPGVDAPISKSIPSRFVSAKKRTYLFQTQKCCQWRTSDGTICGSKFLLEVDHVRPFHAGGTSEIGNLQLLCDQHNRLKYRMGA